MKTKLFFWVAVFLGCFGTAFSQEYHPFLNNSSWILYDTHCCIQTYTRTLNPGTDVVIGDHTYKKFKDPFPQLPSSLTPGTTNYTRIDTVYIREDVAAKKVYHIVNGTDELLYDFTKEVGETIFQYGHNWEVIEVDQIEVDGGTRKRIKLRTIEYVLGYRRVMRWIEGVGSNAHPFYPQCNAHNVASSSGGHGYYTKCSFQGDAHIFGEDDCMSLLATNSQSYTNPNITFSPNPFVSELTINSVVPLQDGTLKIYNVQGQLVREINHLEGKTITINRENLASGLYLVELSEDGQLAKSAKLIVD